MKAIPARLHVLLASHAPTGLVIRRGPSKCVATFLWDRRHDTFELGQWLKARIFERRSDLSPDGKHFLYFAMDGRFQSPSGGSWTAISRAPYLKALALFVKGDGWHGGGLWTSSSRYWLNDASGHKLKFDTPRISRDFAYEPERFGGECPGVYYPRLLRDGWKMSEKSKKLDVFEKPIGDHWKLRKLAHAEIDHPVGKGCYWDEHELLDLTSGRRLAFENWEWADVDRNRLVWAAEGKLWTGRLEGDGLRDEKQLFDFNPCRFEPIKAPY